MKIFIDTNVIVRLYNGDLDLLSASAKKIINNNDVFISPMVIMELEYLFEIQKVKDNAKNVIDYLTEKINLQLDECGFTELIEYALHETWTRDPFDRIIVAHAKMRNASLVSADREIKKRYKKAIW
ncbi:MAG TPA: PIN domain-containing protein [Spirochaetota bacterium]|nr:PIN domain-containing protein [Spirochaetota bacterium]HSA15184.1 PIN domain-containing protein [Spirochaetota bacterium]